MDWSCSSVSDEPGLLHAKKGSVPLATAIDQTSHRVAAARVEVTTAAKQPPPQLSRRHKRKLRFSVHGWSGVASTTLASAAALVAYRNSDSGLSSALSLWAAVTASISASSGVPLIGQAPARTVISKNIIPPHREAFRRTASSVYYLSGRIAWNHIRRYFGLMGTSNDDGAVLAILDLAWGCLSVFYAIRYFLPRIHGTEWRNGNTYVFVVPMASGIMADAVFQSPFFQCCESGAVSTCWNEDVVTEVDLLCVLLSAMVVAFVFTLAFRGSLGIRQCYWGSAIVVHCICVYLILKALPFVILSFVA